MLKILGNHWTKNYKELEEKLLKILQDGGANMNIVHSHLDFQIITAIWELLFILYIDI